MELLDRYLQAVRFWLPPRSRMTSLPNWVTISARRLKTGNRRWVARLTKMNWWRFSSRPEIPCALPGVICRSNLSSDPHWSRFTVCVESSRLGLSGPWILVWIGMMVFMPSYRASHPGLALLGPWTHFWSLAFMLFGAITIALPCWKNFRRASPG